MSKDNRDSASLVKKILVAAACQSIMPILKWLKVGGFGDSYHITIWDGCTFSRFDVCRQFLPKWHIVCARRCHHNFYAKRWWLLGFYDTMAVLDEFMAHPSTSTYVVPLLLGFYETICQKSLTLLFIFIILQCSFLYGKHQRHYESPKLVFLILFCCYIRTRGFSFARVLGREHWLTVLTWVLGRTECTTWLN